MSINKALACEVISQTVDSNTDLAADYEPIIEHRKAINRVTVQQIADQDFDFIICTQGRVHTPITRLMTEARACLTIDEKPLVSIDIANSQMIFLGMLLIESEMNERAEDLDGLDLDSGLDSPLLSRLVSSPSCTKKNNTDYGSPIPISYQPVSSPSCTKIKQFEDSARFIDLVMRGKIYDFLMEKFNAENDIRFECRRQFKGKFFEQVLYGDNDRFYARSTPLALLFQREFPTVWAFIIDQKSWSGKGDKRAAFKALSLRMQQRESRFMIGQVCSRLMQYHPEIPILTIHDSILTHAEHMPTVNRVMLEEFARLGVSPALKIESH